MTALLDQPLRQLARRCRLPGALKPEQQDDTWTFARRLQPAFDITEKTEHLVADDLDDLLRRGQAPQHVLPHGAVADAIDERLDDFEVDVRLEESKTNLPQRGLDALGREPSLSAKGLEDILETRAER